MVTPQAASTAALSTSFLRDVRALLDMILRTSRSPRLDLDGAIVCDWRLGDVW
jgi:hypothetical protein